MRPEQILLGGSLVWLALIIAALLTRRLDRRSGVGLVAMYLALTGLIHIPGAVVNALPWFWGRETELIAAGFTQAFLGMLCFGAGALLLEPLTARLWRHNAQPPPPASLRETPAQVPGRVAPAPALAGPPPELGAATPPLLLATPAGAALTPVARPALLAEQQRLAVLLVGLGLLSILVLTPLTVGVPTGRSIVANMGQLFTIGVGLACWDAWRRQRLGVFQLWLLVAALFPLFTIIADGFLGFGTFALFSVLTFVASFIRLRLHWLLIAVVVGYIGLSFYVTYMRDRSELRAVVWGGAELGQRTDRITATLGSIELFSPQNQQHLVAIDQRLNQNELVGVAVNYLDAGYIDYARGETFLQAVAALVPRVLWPDKPFTAGGSTLVSRFTGVEFDSATSVGIGQVMEFYVNYGTVGVAICFLIFGWLVACFDRRAAGALLAGGPLAFTFWYLPGLALMLYNNSLAEMLSSFGAALLTAFLVTQWLVPALLNPTPGGRR